MVTNEPLAGLQEPVGPVKDTSPPLNETQTFCQIQDQTTNCIRDWLCSYPARGETNTTESTAAKTSNLVRNIIGNQTWGLIAVIVASPSRMTKGVLDKYLGTSGARRPFVLQSLGLIPYMYARH